MTHTWVSLRTLERVINDPYLGASEKSSQLHEVSNNDLLRFQLRLQQNQPIDHLNDVFELRWSLEAAAGLRAGGTQQWEDSHRDTLGRGENNKYEVLIFFIPSPLDLYHSLFLPPPLSLTPPLPSIAITHPPSPSPFLQSPSLSLPPSPSPISLPLLHSPSLSSSFMSAAMGLSPTSLLD